VYSTNIFAFFIIRKFLKGITATKSKFVYIQIQIKAFDWFDFEKPDLKLANERA
jgi:hypothetical protein